MKIRIILAVIAIGFIEWLTQWLTQRETPVHPKHPQGVIIQQQQLGHWGKTGTRPN